MLFIFDFDDTIIDNFQIDYSSFKGTVETLGYSMISKKAFKLLRIKGHLSHEIISKMVPSHKVEEAVQHRKRQIINPSLLHSTVLRPHVRKLIETVKFKGHIVVIATFRKSRIRIIEFLTRNKIFSSIDLLLCRDDYPEIQDMAILKSKFYQQALTVFNISPRMAVAVGDRKTDLFPARRLGIYSIGVDGTYSKKESLLPYADALSDFNLMLKLPEIKEKEKNENKGF